MAVAAQALQQLANPPVVRYTKHMDKKSRQIVLDDSTMDYVSFGSGKQTLVIIPGLSDGLRTVKGTALMSALFFRAFAKKYTVYIFSRKNNLPDNYSIRTMAEDQAKALRGLQIDSAHIMGLSQGGMIAQWLAIDNPSLVKTLTLVVTTSKTTATTKKLLSQWISWAEKGNYRAILKDTIDKTYSERRARKYHPWISIIALMTRPKSLQRFITQAKACQQHDARAQLHSITQPTLIIGGARDAIVGPTATKELAAHIPHAQCMLYADYGHDAYENAAFARDVLAFLRGGISL